VTRTGTSDVSQTVEVSSLSPASPDTAGLGDFTALSTTTLTFAAGVSTQTFTVQTTQDSSYEGAETFRVQLANASAGALISGTNGVATGTIVDDGRSIGGTPANDDRTIAVAGLADVSEGANAIFTVTLPDGNAQPTEISLVLNNGVAGSGDFNSSFTAYYYSGATKVDLTITNGKINLPSGVTSFYVSVPTTQDTAFEGAENFSLSATITGGNSASGSSTIVDDGSGKIYDDKGANPTGPGNDDRPQSPIVVSAPVVLSEPVVQTDAPKPVVTAKADFALPPPAKLFVPEAIPVREVLTSSSGFRAAVVDGALPALTLFKGIEDQFVESIGSVTSFALPSDAFVHTRADASVTLEAKMADGSNLPSWVAFDGQAGVFRFTAPVGLRIELEVKVFARDSEGREAEAKFKINVAPKVQKVGRESLSEKLKLANHKGNAWHTSHGVVADRGERLAMRVNA
jgi:hypothetical protein